MKAGFAERDFTPELPEELNWKNPERELRPVHDPCKARAAVFEADGTRVAFVGCDSESMLRSVTLAARAEIESVCGIPGENVMIAASHSHNAPLINIVEPGLFDHAPDFVRHLAYERRACPSPAYLDFMRRQIVAAVVAADRDKVDAVCATGSGQEGSVTFNRRFRMKNGLTCSLPNKDNPGIIEPAGPIDPEVGVLGAWDRSGNFLGCLVNFACHCTTAPGGLSADWVYYLERTVRGALGEEAGVVFLNGACGDVTQIDYLDDCQYEIGERAARRLGQCVGAETLKVLARAEPGELGPLATRREFLSLKRRVPSPERLEEAWRVVRSDDPDPEEMHRLAYTEPERVTRVKFAQAIVLLDALIAREPVVEVEVQAIQVGPALFLSNPAEFFCRLGLDVKAASPFPFTFVVELANGCVGYTPTEEAFGPRGGGMETRLWEYANLEPFSGRRIAEASIRLAAGLSPGPVPECPKAEPFKEPFAFGTNPPELE